MREVLAGSKRYPQVDPYLVKHLEQVIIATLQTRGLTAGMEFSPLGRQLKDFVEASACEVAEKLRVVKENYVDRTPALAASAVGVRFRQFRSPKGPGADE